MPQNHVRAQLVEPFFEDPFSYSRLSTWLDCAYKGHRVYDLGFEPGTQASYNFQGKLVHETIEKLHRATNVWDLTKRETIELAHSLLDKKWALVLGGREEFAWLKNYGAALDRLYADCKKEQERMTQRPCRAPWMTRIWKEKYQPILAPKERILKQLMRSMNYVEFDPLPSVFKNTYEFVETYCRLVHQEFFEPDELFLEYEDDPLVVYKGDIQKDLGLTFAFQSATDTRFVFPFRGAIDQLWFSVSKNGEVMDIFDIKTSRMAFTEDKVRHHDQLFLYADHVLQTYGRLPRRVGIIDLKNAAVVAVEPTVEDMERFRAGYLAKIALVSLIKKERLYAPAAGSGMNFCGHCALGNHGGCEYYTPTAIPFTPNETPRKEA